MSQKEKSTFELVALLFRNEIRGLYQFNSMLVPVVVEHDKKVNASIANLYSSAIKELESLGLELNSSFKEVGLEDTKVFERVTKSSDGLASAKESVENLREALKWVGNLPRENMSISKQERFVKYAEHVELFVKALQVFKPLSNQPPNKMSFLSRGTLSVLISTFENFVSDVLHFYYSQFPNALSENHVITLAELRQFETIKEVEKDLASKEVKKVIDGGIQEIRKWFEKHHSKKLSVSDEKWNRITEVFARRNIEVHNNGCVDSTYLRRVDKIIAKEYQATLGKFLYIEPGYLENAIDNLYYCGHVILLDCWIKWDRPLIRRGYEFVIDSITYLLEDKRFEAVCLLSEYALTIPKLSDKQREKISDSLSIARNKIASQNE